MNDPYYHTKTIEDLWAIQQEFYETIRIEKGNMSDEEFAHALVLHLHAEASELLEAIGGPWKTHVAAYDCPKKSQVLSEVVDLVKLSIEVAMVYGIEVNEFKSSFVIKSKVVDQRRKSEQFLSTKNTSPVVFDFDGVLSEYPKPFVDFLREEGQANVEVDGPDDVWQCTNLTVDEYDQLKQQYWETKRPMKAAPIMSAVTLVKKLYNNGIPVVVVTSRDRNFLETAEHSTYQWMASKGLRVDGIYFTSDKARFIKKHFPNAIAVVDDDEHEVQRMWSAGINAVKVDSTEAEDIVTFKQVETMVRQNGYHKAQKKLRELEAK